MSKYGENKITRYNQTGKELQKIQRDNKGEKLYGWPHYVTENVNGDICVSDYSKHAVVVTDKSGQHRFSYTGQGPSFFPYGICTDVLGHILVCDGLDDSVLLLDQNGLFLSQVLNKKMYAICVCVNGEKDLLSRKRINNTVTVCKYLL
jgi:hypothetical protein